MQVEAIYDDGRLVLPAGVHLKHSRIHLTVFIPDHELVAAVRGDCSGEQASVGGQRGDTSPSQPSIREAINDILGPWRQQIESGSPLTAEDRDRLRDDALKKKYLDHR